MKNLAVALMLSLALVACGDDPNNVTREQFGDAWPFTTERGNLYCNNGNQIVFASAGGLYAINGTAIASGKYQPVDPIWVNDPTTGAKKSLAGIIDKGLQLCK